MSHLSAKDRDWYMMSNQNQVIQVTEWRKKTLFEPRLSQWPVLLWPTNEQYMVMIQAALYARSQIGLEHPIQSRENISIQMASERTDMD